MTYLKASILCATVVVALTSFFGLHQSAARQERSAQDGPTTVKYDTLFKTGDLKIEPFDLASLPPLPTGYAVLNNKAYRITTNAVVAGRHTISFAAPSVTDEDTFKKLRIFHLDKDPYDPDGFVWIDVTLSKSETASPSFSTRTIYAQSEGLGIYVIAKLVREVPPNTSIADLVVTTSGVADRITAPGLISYTIKVFNQGPDNASDVGLWDGLSGHANLVSAEPSQGKCKPSGGHIVCKLGYLKAGESITVAVKLKPDEGRGSFPKEGKEVTHDAGARATEKDPTLENNEASDTVVVFPDPNQPPIVTLNSPKDEALFVGPVDITLEAFAQDVDGSISKVEFFDNGKSLGLGTSVDGKNFILTARGLSYGNHALVAVATDNGGRLDWSLYRSIFINGLSHVSVKSPEPDTVVAPGSDFTLEALASHPSGVIDKLQFFSNGKLLGEGSISGPKTYSFNWKGVRWGNYSIAAIAIDGSGIPTVSTPVEFKVGIPPEVSIISPSDLSRFSFSRKLTITATAKPAAGLIIRMDFYANGRLIGSMSGIASNTFNFTWTNVPVGRHTLKAVAVDERGVSGNSKSVTVTIGKPQA